VEADAGIQPPSEAGVVEVSDKLTLDRETFKALSADTRIDILKRLQAHKLTLTDLSQQMGMSPSTVSEHLERLVEVGLILQEDKGMKWKYYRLTDKGRNILSPQETKVWILLGTTLLMLMAASLSMFAKLMVISSVGNNSATYGLASAPQPRMLPARVAENAIARDEDAVSTGGTADSVQMKAKGERGGSPNPEEETPTTLEEEGGGSEESGGPMLLATAAAAAPTTSSTTVTSTSSTSEPTTSTIPPGVYEAPQESLPEPQFPWLEVAVAIVSLIAIIWCGIYLVRIRRNRII
jgi:DNA-binding transcriptional ArsR family regulator